MAECTFAVERRFCRVEVTCPKCKGQTAVQAFIAKPVVQGDGPFVRCFDLLAVLTCRCGYHGSRVVGRVKEKPG